MQTAPDQTRPTAHPPQSGAASILPADQIKRMREILAKSRADERARDARMLAAYQRECLAAWEAA